MKSCMEQVSGCVVLSWHDDDDCSIAKVYSGSKQVVQELQRYGVFVHLVLLNIRHIRYDVSCSI